MRVLRALRRLLWILPGIALLFAVYLLPPDTSLAELRRSGILPVCVPASQPPLITGDPAAPGIDAELLAAIAGELSVRLALQTVPEMGRDFDPRSWHLTRARCAMIAGGVVGSAATRSFLEVGPPYAETGWVAIGPAAADALADRPVGVLVASQGLDRIALSRWLRGEGARVTLVRTPGELTAGLGEGRFSVAITEALLGRSLAAGTDWTLRDLPLERYPVVLGLWKGDLTLKRAVARAFDAIARDGRLAAILARYGLADQRQDAAVDTSPTNRRESAVVAGSAI